MPETFTLTPQFEYIEREHYRTYKTPFDSGHTQKRAGWPRPRRVFLLKWSAATQIEKEYTTAFFRDHVGPAGSFIYQPADPVPTPSRNGDVSQVSGGALAQRTYYYQISWVTALGETRAATENSFLISANNLFRLIVPLFPTNVTKCRIYASTTSGATQLQVEIISPASKTDRTWTEPIGGLISGAAPPSTNTAKENVNVNLMDDTFEWTKLTAGAYSMEAAFEEIL